MIFPGFPDTPTRQRFPLYGFIPEGKGFAMQVEVRERTEDGTSRSTAVQTLDLGRLSRREAEKQSYALNAAVWAAMGA